MLNLVYKEYQKKARSLFADWQSRDVFRPQFTPPSPLELAALIDLRLLDPEASISAVNKACREALQNHLASVCVQPLHVERSAALLEGRLALGTVISYPLGANHSRIKVAEAELAGVQGAHEIQLVLSTGLLKTANFQEIFEEMQAVRQVFPQGDLTVVLESGRLDPHEIIIVCLLAREAGADDVMPATGFQESSASVDTVSLIRHVLGTDLGVKSAPISSPDAALNVLRAGASRLAVNAHDLAGLLTRLS